MPNDSDRSSSHPSAGRIVLAMPNRSLSAAVPSANRCEAGAGADAAARPAAPSPAPPRTSETGEAKLHVTRLGSGAAHRRPSRAWLILPMGLAGAIVAIVIGVLLHQEEPQTVSEVMRQVRDIVLQRSDRPGVEDGGALGSLWISAQDADVMTGTLIGVRVRAGDVRLAARESRLIVDPDENTISFALDDVVFFRVPGNRINDASEQQSIMELDTFVIGPLPYKRRIVQDGHPAGDPAVRGHLAGAASDD